LNNFASYFKTNAQFQDVFLRSVVRVLEIPINYDRSVCPGQFKNTIYSRRVLRTKYEKMRTGVHSVGWDSAVGIATR
jgi:hypothetical protein